MLIESKRDLLLGLLVATTAFFVYANTLLNGFVWDDAPVILEKQVLRGDILSLFAVPDRVLDTDPAIYYRPLTYTTFLLEERLHGLNPSFMHLANVLLHAANAFLVFFVARSLINSSYAAIIAGLLFAIHPINAETVNFISGGRNTMLACFFLLLTFLLHKRCIRKNALSGAVFGAFAILAGVLSKEIAICILPFIVALEMNNMSRTAPDDRRRAIMRLVPYMAMLAVYFGMRSMALVHAGISIEMSHLGSRFLSNIYIIPRYFLTIVWPFSLNIRYYLPDDFHPLALPLVTAWGCICGLLGWILTRKDRRISMFGIMWALAFWMPVSGIIPFPSAPLAERYLYVPAIGLWLVIADRTA